MPRFDAIVIGTGQAGPSLARRLVAAGRKVAVIERKHFGGTCVNTGCMPTKALVASAYAAARGAPPCGLRRHHRRAGRGRHEGREGAQGRDRARPRATASSVRSSRSKAARCIRGTARFVARNEVQVGETVLRRRRSSSMSAGAPSVPPMPGPRSGAVSHQFQHDGCGLPARASDRRRRQLYRAGVRAGLSALRREGHGGRDGAAADRARGRGRLDGRRRRARKPKASSCG